MPRRYRLSAFRRVAAAALLAAVVSHLHAPALAQQPDVVEKTTEPRTRAAEARAKREAKAIALVPVQRTKVEAFLYKVDEDLILQRIFNPPRGFHVRLGGVGDGGGFGGGAGYRFTSVPFNFQTSAAASRKGYFIAEGSLRFPGTQSESLYTWANGPYVEVYGRRRESPREDFFGLGPDSLEADRSNYAQRDTLVRATPAIRYGYLITGVNLGYFNPSIGSGTDENLPSTDEVFAPDEIPGLEVQPAFGVVEPFVEFATLDRAIEDRAGGRYRVTFTRYNDRDLDQFSFSQWNVDLRQFIPFVRDTHTVALRAWASSSDPLDGDSVPFYLQPTLGGSQSLRGYRSLRFRDRSALLLQGEYRWRINEFVTGALFYDAGAVAARLGDIGRLEADYGVSLRAGSRSAVAVRVDLAFGGREGTRLFVRFADVF
jgi:hypothetical protein